MQRRNKIASLHNIGHFDQLTNYCYEKKEKVTENAAANDVEARKTLDVQLEGFAH